MKEEREELTRLRREVRELRMEREVLEYELLKPQERGNRELPGSRPRKPCSPVGSLLGRLHRLQQRVSFDSSRRRALVRVLPERHPFETQLPDSADRRPQPECGHPLSATRSDELINDQ